jgi:hypothetical protein
MATVERSGSEVFDSLTGYDEIAIEKAAGSPVEVLQENRKVLLLRCLVAVDIMRESQPKVTYPLAYKQAMEMTISEVNDYFDASDENDIDPDDPDSEPGKDD